MKIQIQIQLWFNIQICFRFNYFGEKNDLDLNMKPTRPSLELRIEFNNLNYSICLKEID